MEIVFSTKWLPGEHAQYRADVKAQAAMSKAFRLFSKGLKGVLDYDKLVKPSLVGSKRIPRAGRE